MKEEGTPQNAKTKKRSFGKKEYKFWVLGAIIIVALWSIFTASLTLKWSAGNLLRDFHSTNLRDFDVLEVEEREKVVRHMWDLYGHSKSHSRSLPRFWKKAFHAAYEHLVSDVRSVRDAAVSEIAKMSLRSYSMQNIKGSRKIMQAE